ncbi:hypothetical protein K438DRAFT_1770987 [Mycena galopus ATCC 62051]|nr:hypothetical protein K438DRAFT_1770987 [Mycena galopus ATCC 62051]
MYGKVPSIQVLVIAGHPKRGLAHMSFVRFEEDSEASRFWRVGYVKMLGQGASKLENPLTACTYGIDGASRVLPGGDGHVGNGSETRRRRMLDGPKENKGFPNFRGSTPAKAGSGPGLSLSYEFGFEGDGDTLLRLRLASDTCLELMDETEQNRKGQLALQYVFRGMKFNLEAAALALVSTRPPRKCSTRRPAPECGLGRVMYGIR